MNKGSTFLGNDWWNPEGGSKFMKFNNLAGWANETGQEMLKGHFKGMQVDPRFKGPLVTDITDPYDLEKLLSFTLQPDSPLKNKGMNLKSVLNIVPPLRDFYGNSVPLGDGTEPGIFEMK
jgi:hypothetical protein